MVDTIKPLSLSLSLSLSDKEICCYIEASLSCLMIKNKPTSYGSKNTSTYTYLLQSFDCREDIFDRE